MLPLHKILDKPAPEVAPLLLGALLRRTLNGKTIVSRIVEVEAYDQADPASHTFRGETPRTKTMFGPAGCLYVYFTYGMHFCCNVVTGSVGQGAAVLIRALEPLEGLESARLNRPNVIDSQLMNGPGKLCQALTINKTYDGHNLEKPPIELLLQEPLPESDITQTTRVGISSAKDVLWRFYITGNTYISRT